MFSILKNLFGQKDNSQLKESIKNGAILVDVRTPGEFSSGSVKSAINIPLNQLSSQISKLKNKKEIIVFCKSGGRSAQAKVILEQNGFNNVINGGSYSNVNDVLNG